MANKDDLLQNYIKMLETGTPLEQVLAQLPERDANLRDLIRLTAAIRAAPQPVPGQAANRNGKVYAIIREHAQRQPAARPKKAPSWLIFPRLAFSAVMLIALAIIMVVTLNTFVQPVDALLTISDVSGQVEIASASDAPKWQPVKDGSMITAGQRLRSGSHSTATLKFADGSMVHLAPNSELAFTVLEQQEGALVVKIHQPIGHTRHEIVPLRSPEALYIVHTPSGDAQVLGTVFSVSVAANGHAYFAVDKGLVTVTADGMDVAVAAGHTTGTQTGSPPTAPVRYFRSQGELLLKNQTIWQIDEMLVYVTEETIQTDSFAVGDFVLVSGRILPNGRWQADSIEPADDTTHQAAFAGVLQVITPELWLVDGVSVKVSQQTVKPEHVAVGDLVRVIYSMGPDGNRSALEVEVLTSVAINATQPPRPSLEFDPDEIEAFGCEVEFLVTGTLSNEGSSPDDVAADVELGYTLLTGSQFVESVTLTPAGWDTIQAGETVSFTVQVSLTDDWLSAPPETEVKLRVFIAAESNRPDHHIGRVTITLIQTCESTATPTPSTTPDQTATPTPTGTIFPSPTPTGPVSGDCTGVSPHPEATRLAQVYNVPYEEIIGWFCSGFGFGEIDLAYNLSIQSGTDVAEIFAMRASGLGWGEIMQALGLLPGAPPPAGASVTPPVPPGASMTPPTPPGPQITPPAPGGGPPPGVPGGGDDEP